jgi:hypothetical protein
LSSANTLKALYLLASLAVLASSACEETAESSSETTYGSPVCAKTATTPGSSGNWSTNGASLTAKARRIL